MSSIIRFGLDLAKSSFAICGVDVAERIVLRRTVSRSELLVVLSQQLPAVVAMEYGSGIRHLALSRRENKSVTFSCVTFSFGGPYSPGSCAART